MYPQSLAKSKEVSVSLFSPSQSVSLLTKWASYRRLAHVSRRLRQMDREDLLAGMLLFRVLYYLAPFVISVILLTFREVILGARIKRLRRATPGIDAAPAREAAYVRERGDTGA